jgi:hypothetical protein
VPERESVRTQQFIFNNLQVYILLVGTLTPLFFDSGRGSGGVKLLETSMLSPLSNSDSGLTAGDSGDSGCGGAL